MTEYTPDIKPLVIYNYNNTNNPKELRLKLTSATDIISNSNEYFVSVKKLECPVGNKYAPINNETEPFNVCLFYEPKTGTHPNLVYGPNYFSFNGPFYSVQDYLDKLNAILAKAEPESLGFFREEEEIIKFVSKGIFAPNFDNVLIYFDLNLTKLFTFDFDYNDTFSHLGSDFYRFTSGDALDVSVPGYFYVFQNIKTYSKFYKLKSINVYSTLPTEEYLIYDMINKTLVMSNLLTEVTFNTELMYNNTNILYEPKNFNYYSLKHSNFINNFEVWFTYRYANGQEVAIFLDSKEFSSITISFEKKNMI